MEGEEEKAARRGQEKSKRTRAVRNVFGASGSTTDWQKIGKNADR